MPGRRHFDSEALAVDDDTPRSEASAASTPSASASGGPRRKKKAPKALVRVNLLATKYDVVYRCCTARGWRPVSSDEAEWNVYWTDTSVSSERLMRLEPYQRLNHFPGMLQICRKVELARNLSRMQQVFPQEFGFFPRTFLLPLEFNEFKNQFDRRGKSGGAKTFIIKPDANCQGKGIFLTRTWENVNPREAQVAQRYLHKPLLIEGLKFDLRIYALVTSCDPLRVFLYQDGLTRLCTTPYAEPTTKNLRKQRMHLTNYAINKTARDYVPASQGDVAAAAAAAEAAGAGSDRPLRETGSKRSLRWFLSWLRDQGHDADKLWADIGDVVVKSLISIQPSLAHIYHSCLPHDTAGDQCFEILGFDILVDRKIQPWLIEVNHSPSFTCDTELDRSVKEGLIESVLGLVNVSAYDKRRQRQQASAAARSRLYGPKNGATPTAAGAGASRSAAAARQKARAKQNRLEAKYADRLQRIFPPANPQKAADFGRLVMAANDIFEAHATRRGTERSTSKSTAATTTAARQTLFATTPSAASSSSSSAAPSPSSSPAPSVRTALPAPPARPTSLPDVDLCAVAVQPTLVPPPEVDADAVGLSSRAIRQTLAGVRRAQYIESLQRQSLSARGRPKTPAATPPPQQSRTPQARSSSQNIARAIVGQKRRQAQRSSTPPAAAAAEEGSAGDDVPESKVLSPREQARELNVSLADLLWAQVHRKSLPGSGSAAALLPAKARPALQTMHRRASSPALRS